MSPGAEQSTSPPDPPRSPTNTATNTTSTPVSLHWHNTSHNTATAKQDKPKQHPPVGSQAREILILEAFLGLVCCAIYPHRLRAKVLTSLPKSPLIIVVGNLKVNREHSVKGGGTSKALKVQLKLAHDPGSVLCAMNTGKAPACVPTWRGHIETTKDALIIFEACFNGTLAHCFRRPHDRERNSLIVSGNVFVYEEATSGIKRWTDGIPWSPSRILTNFLIYRQLNSPFPPGEKKRATKRSQRPIKAGEQYPTSANSTPTTDEARPFPPESPNTSSIKAEESPDKDANRGLVGSLVDSYEFKENGLLKKTMTVTVHNVQHHLVSYYSLDDAKYNLKTPREDPLLKDIPIREALLNQPKFKFPNLDDAGDGTYEQMEGSQNPYPTYYQNGYDPSRMYSAPNASIQAPQVSSPMGSYHGVYAPAGPPPSSGSGYASIAPTTANYVQTVGHVQYPQHQPLGHQQPYSHMNQQVVSPYQGQQQQHHYQPQQYPVQASHSQEQLQHSNFPQQAGGNALPRPSAMEFLPQEGGGLAHDPYSSTAIKTEGMAPTSQSQQWSMPGPGYAQQWAHRQEGPQYPPYRAQS